MPMSLAPTQMEPATCGSQVKGLLMNTVANSTGRFSRNSTPSMTQVTRCTRQGSRRNEGDEQPQGEGAGDAVPMEGPAAAIEHDRL